MLAPVFPEWAATWSHLGLWLTLWGQNGVQVASGGAGSPFWENLLRHSACCRERLGELARRSGPGPASFAALDRTGGIRVAAVPLLHHQRHYGAVLACALSSEFLDEEVFARFCDAHQLDRIVFARLSAGLPVIEQDQLEAIGRILSHQMQALHGQALDHSEIGELTEHLAQTYEELNLIYRISAGMNALAGPVSHLEQVCREVVGATLVESVVAILKPRGGSGEHPVVVRSGPLTASDQDLIRLCQLVRGMGCPDGPARVFNHVRQNPEFAWASEWLRQLAFYDLARKDKVFGGILAVNRTDGQDFGSCEVQLLSAIADRSASFLETIRLYDDLEHLFLGMLHALVNSIDAKDPYTCGHSQRVAWLSRHLAMLAGIPDEKCQRVYLAGLLHDIGKIGVPEAVLRKSGRLTNHEFQEIKRHPEIGARILANVWQVEDIIPGVLHHHERLDGRGYPAGLNGAQVPFLGRVIGLADSFDAMTTNRTYRPAQMVQIAAAEIRRCAGTQFDPKLAEMLLAQDLSALHARMTEFGQQPIRATANGQFTSFMGGRL